MEWKETNIYHAFGELCNIAMCKDDPQWIHENGMCGRLQSHNHTGYWTLWEESSGTEVIFHQDAVTCWVADDREAEVFAININM